MWSFRKKPKTSQEAKFVPFASMDLSYAKTHGLRALCGLLMDRHSACTTCPFCGINDDDDILQLIVHVEMQTDATTEKPLLAFYFCKAVYPSESPKANNIEEWAARLTYAEAAPNRKAVVNLLDNGAYYAEYGPIANPTQGHYSTGSLAREDWTLFFYCNPEPTYTRWQYWESQVTLGQRVVPEFRCLQTQDEWWVVDIDRERKMVQQVAAITVADNPDHLGRQLNG
ncbi:MAG: hypothetical protein OXD46_07930 [Chloroflexi bacterium]|nr:hypothetical protein [Chloroflexota bacterium]